MEITDSIITPSVSHIKTTDEIMLDLQAKAAQAAELTAKERRLMLESDDAQVEIVTANVLFEAKQAASDEDTYRKTHRIATETLREIDLGRKTKSPDTDVVILVLTIDNTRIDVQERIGQNALVEHIKKSLPNEFSQNRWRIASLSVKHDTLNSNTILGGRDKTALLPTLFTLIQSAHTHRAKNVYPLAFKSPERPNRVVQPRFQYQPGLHINPDIS